MTQMNGFPAAVESISDDPCAECGLPLGDRWRMRYNAETERQQIVHIECPKDELVYNHRKHHWEYR